MSDVNETTINTNINDITIASSAVLVDLTIRGWTGKKQDKEVSDEVGHTKNATTSKAGAYQKNLLAGSSHLDYINKYASMIRKWHMWNTLPWSDSGTRLLPAIKFQEYMAGLGAHEAEYNRRVADFVSEYTLLIQAAQFSLGDMFKIDDYPAPSEIPAKFELRSAVYPLPDTGDFRVDIGNQGLNELRQQFQRQQDARLNEAMGEVRSRIKDALSKISKQLKVDEDGKKGRIHDVTIETALELCSALDGFNLTRDPELDKLKKNMHMVLTGYDATELRKDDVVRHYMKTEVDDLLEKFSW